MADSVDAARRSAIMRNVPSQGSKPEMRVRRALHAAGYRFRLHRKDLPGRPDVVLPRFGVAVFVHGCFWHWHGCKRSRMPESNREYWVRKIQRNVDRDHARQADLERLGWRVRVIWECDLCGGVDRLCAELARARSVGSRIERSFGAGSLIEEEVLGERSAGRLTEAVPNLGTGMANQ